MDSQANIEFTRRFVVEVLNTGDMDKADEFLAPNFVEHSAPPGFPGTREGVKQVFLALHQAFPDFKYVIDETFADGDSVVLRMRGQGTMRGPFFQYAPTGKFAEWPEIHIAKLRDGLIVEHWDVIDRLTRLQALGLYKP
jgi:predicted ester cyclase